MSAALDKDGKLVGALVTDAVNRHNEVFVTALFATGEYSDAIRKP